MRKLEIKIFSREAMEKFLQNSPLIDIAVISFYDTPMIENDPYYVAIAYPKDIAVYYSVTDDIDYESLQERGYTENSYFADCDDMAKFILQCADKGIIKFFCQCEFGQSRSSGAAAAIAEFFNHNGVDIFADYRYSPNQVIYNKLINSLISQNFINQLIKNDIKNKHY